MWVCAVIEVRVARERLKRTRVFAHLTRSFNTHIQERKRERDCQDATAWIKLENMLVRKRRLERTTTERESRVSENYMSLLLLNSSKTGHEKPCPNPGGPPSKANYIIRSIVNEYREGKVKRTP